MWNGKFKTNTLHERIGLTVNRRCGKEFYTSPMFSICTYIVHLRWVFWKFTILHLYANNLTWIFISLESLDGPSLHYKQTHRQTQFHATSKWWGFYMLNSTGHAVQIHIDVCVQMPFPRSFFNISILNYVHLKIFQQCTCVFAKNSISIPYIYWQRCILYTTHVVIHMSTFKV